MILLLIIMNSDYIFIWIQKNQHAGSEGTRPFCYRHNLGFRSTTPSEWASVNGRVLSLATANDGIN
jgi:hypothetical protein